jgi:uncharacterized membrane protein
MDEGSAPAGRHVRPFHPPFTHFPIAAYVMAAAFDLISVFGGNRHQWSAQLFRAGTFVLVAGLAVCLLTMASGFFDLVRFGERRPEAIRAIAVHVCVMAAVFMVGVGDIAWRLVSLGQASTPPGILALTVTAAIGVCIGGYFGGTIVYKHGSGVGVTAASLAQRRAQDAAEPLIPEPARTSAAGRRRMRDGW